MSGTAVVIINRKGGRWELGYWTCT